MGTHRSDALGIDALDSAARVPVRRYLLRVASPPLAAVCFVALTASPILARGALPSSERAALNLAIALSLSHLAARNVAPGSALIARGNSAPVAAKEELPTIDAAPMGATEAVPIAQAQSGDQGSPTGDSGTGARRATEQGGPNGPDDRNLGSGGPTRGTTPAPAGAVQDNNQGSGGATGSSGSGAGGKSGSSGDESGSGSESNGSNQRSPAPQQ